MYLRSVCVCLKVRASVCHLFFPYSIEYAAYVIAMCAQNVSKPYSNKMVFKVAQHTRTHIHTTQQQQQQHTRRCVVVFLHHFLDIFLLLISFSSSFFGSGDVLYVVITIWVHIECDNCWAYKVATSTCTSMNVRVNEWVWSCTNTHKNLQRAREWSAFWVRVRSRGPIYVLCLCVCVSPKFFPSLWQTVVTKFFQSKNALLY